MTDQPTEHGEESAPSNAELADRMGHVESTLNELAALIRGGEGRARGAAQARTEQRLDQPTSVADEVRRQLEDRDRAAAEQAGRKSDADRLAAVETTVAELAEKPPEVPVRKIENLMGWRPR